MLRPYIIEYIPNNAIELEYNFISLLCISIWDAYSVVGHEVFRWQHDQLTNIEQQQYAPEKNTHLIHFA